jgi:hypothetical protein
MPLLHSLLTVLSLTEFVQKRCWRLGRQVGADVVVLVRQQRALDGLCTQYESWVRTVERVWKYWPTVQLQAPEQQSMSIDVESRITGRVHPGDYVALC